MKIIPVILLLVFSCAVCAQELKEKYAEADGFRQKYEAGYFEGNITPRWIGNTHFCWYAVKTPAGTDFILVNAGKRQKQPAFDQKAMAKALTAELGRKVEPGKMPFREIAFSDDLKQLTFVVEGMKMVSEVPQDRLVKVYFSESFAAANVSFLNKFAKEQTELVSDIVFAQMSDTKTPQGALAIVKMAQYTVQDMMKDKPLLLLVENLQDPGNLGTIVRMAEGAGVTGVILSPNTVDIYNPKTIRSTMGSVYRVPFFYAKDFTQQLADLKQAGVRLYAAHLDGNCEYTQPDYTGASAFLIGNEANGLTKASSDAADVLVRIPMQGQVESFNAAVACTILTFEAVRQRRTGVR